MSIIVVDKSKMKKFLLFQVLREQPRFYKGRKMDLKRDSFAMKKQKDFLIVKKFLPNRELEDNKGHKSINI